MFLLFQGSFLGSTLIVGGVYTVLSSIQGIDDLISFMLWLVEVEIDVSNENKHGCLGYIGDYTPQF